MSFSEVGRGLWRRAAPPALKQAVGRLAQPVVFELTVRQCERLSSLPGRGPVALVGAYAQSSGIAASAHLASEALDHLGVEHRRVDIGDFGDPATPQDQEAAAWVFYINPPELVHLFRQWRPGRIAGPRYAYWAWELPRAPASWRRARAAVQGVMVPSHFTANAFRDEHSRAKHGQDGYSKVSVIPHPLASSAFARFRRDKPRRPGQPFRVVSVFDFRSSVARKNPTGALRAFKRAFGDDPSARLIIKTQNGHEQPAIAEQIRQGSGANVQFIDEVWPRSRILDLIASSDAMLSLHRSEGFGLTLAEAMMLGTPVVATDWSGNSDFMDPACACLVPARMTAVIDGQGIYRRQHWADPDEAAAARHLWRLAEDVDFAFGLSVRARARVEVQLSPAAWMESLPAPLRAALISGPGA